LYLRHITVRKRGKQHTYWALVRSVRCGRKVRQELVATLGELNAEGRVKARRLARQITGREQPGQLELFEEPATEEVSVRLRGVRFERGRRFGDVWLGWVLWTALQFDVLFKRLLPGGQEDVAWSQMIALSVLARLCEPSSELHIAEHWYRTTALDDLLGIPVEKVNDDRLYRTLDILLPCKEAVERHTKRRLGELFDVSYDILLYDLTSTYFEGEALGNELARRGHSRDQRPDCKQVNIALVVSKEGLPLAHEVFPGNTSDVKTICGIVSQIEERFGKADRIWIVDRGMVSEEVLTWLRAGERSYIVGTPKSELKKFEADLLSESEWHVVREGLDVKQATVEGRQETFVLCRSEARQEKEHAMRERFAARIEAGLKRMEHRLSQARKRQNHAVLGKQIGRLLQRNARAAKHFDIEVHERRDRLSGVEVKWQRNTKNDEWAELSEGCYLLRAHGTKLSDEEVWKAYIQLTQVEEAFRIHKTELEIRPVWHQTADRVRAHILVCFLAYVLWKTLEQWSERAGLGRSPRKLLQEVAQIKSGDVLLPTTDGRELRVRCVARPEKALSLLLERLGLELPKRLRTVETMIPQTAQM
jgi:transposase